jgi:rod shape-determining protein MreD
MELTRKQNVIKYVCYCLIILVVDLLQNTGGLFPEIFGARCFLLLPLVIILSMSEDVFAGTMLGLFAGLLWDLTGAVHLGFNCIFIAVMCFFSSALATYITRDTFITNMISSAIVITLYCLMYWLFFIIIKGVDGGELTIFSFYIPSGIYTAVLTPVLWLILKPIKMKLNHEKEQNFS